MWYGEGLQEFFLSRVHMPTVPSGRVLFFFFFMILTIASIIRHYTAL
jgi:hypothetical protein